jgi:hypothetical protein
MDVGERTEPSSPTVGMILRRTPDEVGCPLCAIGYCSVVYRIDADSDEPRAIHGMAGTA